jgi:hypothetical protein
VLAGWLAVRRSGRDACHAVRRAPGAVTLAYAAPRRTKLGLPLAWLIQPSHTRAASTAPTCGRTLRPWRKPGAIAVLTGLIVVAAAPWSGWGFCRAAAGPPRLKPWKPERFPAVLVPEPVQSNQPAALDRGKPETGRPQSGRVSSLDR